MTLYTLDGYTDRMTFAFAAEEELDFAGIASASITFEANGANPGFSYRIDEVEDGLPFVFLDGAFDYTVSGGGSSFDASEIDDVSLLEIQADYQGQELDFTLLYLVAYEGGYGQGIGYKYSFYFVLDGDGFPIDPDSMSASDMYAWDDSWIGGGEIQSGPFAPGRTIDFADLQDVEITTPVVPGVSLNGTAGNDQLSGSAGNDTIMGGAGDDTISGGAGDDLLMGDAGDDVIHAGDGADTIHGGDGDDIIYGGASSADRRDVIYAGSGDDFVDGGYGNDLIYGMDGNDTISGGFGADELYGQNGDDVINGGALSDLIFGGAGDDFLNGGFGHDRLNGGAGADTFYHLGIRDHGSDWVQDYDAAEGDVLLFGTAGASADDFQVNYARTANAGGAADEAFVIYKPTGQIIWALVDGGAQDEINLQLQGVEGTFDLMA